MLQHIQQKLKFRVTIRYHTSLNPHVQQKKIFKSKSSQVRHLYSLLRNFPPVHFPPADYAHVPQVVLVGLIMTRHLLRRQEVLLCLLVVTHHVVDSTQVVPGQKKSRIMPN